VNREERYVERKGRLLTGEPSEIAKDKHRALFEVERFERSMYEGARLPPGQLLVGQRRGVDTLLPRARDLEAMTREPPVVGGDSESEAEEPRAQGSRAVVVGEVPVDAHPHLVRDVLEIRVAYPEAAERRPDVIELGFERFAKGVPLGRTRDG